MYRAGWLLAGRYRLVSQLAVGGMGEIWLARDELLKRDVAAKLVRAEYAADASFRRRLHAEARAAAAVRNPHVVDVYDVGNDIDSDAAPVSFVIMELVPGRSLAEVLADAPLSAPEATDVIAQVADALTTAHARAVVHRDIKPANIMRDAAGHVTVLDFGIARAADAAALTATGTLLGTARYMSPEQVDGAPASPASDVYSLGVVGYHCLTGRPPFDAGSDVATALAHRDQPPPALPSTVPAPLAAMIARCLAKRPADRPSAAELARDAAALTMVRPPAPRVPTPAVVPVPTQAADADAATTGLDDVSIEDSGVPRWLGGRRVAAMTGVGIALIAVLTVAGIANGGSHPAAAAAGGPAQLAAATTPGTVAAPASSSGKPAKPASGQAKAHSTVAHHPRHHAAGRKPLSHSTATAAVLVRKRHAARRPKAQAHAATSPRRHPNPRPPAHKAPKAPAAHAPAKPAKPAHKKKKK